MANGNVLYLPPGVVPPTPNPVSAPLSTGVPFDRTFFEKILPQAIGAFCQQTDCSIPRVELLTVDGSSHYVTGIIAVTDIWVSLQVAKEEHDHPIQMFIPYQTIYRVEVHPESERRKHIGFIRQPAQEVIPAARAKRTVKAAPAAAPAEVPAPAAEVIDAKAEPATGEEAPKSRAPRKFPK